jgi:HAD superfamily hydrolase (TIGR01509 family)
MRGSEPRSGSNSELIRPAQRRATTPQTGIGSVGLETTVGSSVKRSSEARNFGFDELWRAVEEQSSVTFPGNFDLLRDLREAERIDGGSYRIATLNNESRELNNYRIQTFDLRRFFDYFVCSGYVGEMKPLPGIYRSALEISSTPAEQTLFVDDKAENCDAARKMGMNAIQFISPEQLRSDFGGFGITL